MKTNALRDYSGTEMLYSSVSLPDILEAVEGDIIFNLLSAIGWDKKAVAERMGITIQRLIKLMAKHGIDEETWRDSERRLKLEHAIVTRKKKVLDEALGF